MTESGIITFWSAIAAFSITLVLVRVVGEFVVGHSFAILERYRNRRGDKS